MSALREAFIDELKDLFDAEKQLLKALPKMAKAAENGQLGAAFQEHEAQTQKHLWRLGQVFEAFEEKASGKHCKGMEGLIKEARELIKEKEGDAALIAAAQKAEHYEIAAYGTLASWAVSLGQEEVLQYLNQTLEEEKETDKKLTMIAQNVVNSEESMRDEEESEPAKPRRKTTIARRTKAPKASRNRGARRRTTPQKNGAPRSKRLRSANK